MNTPHEHHSKTDSKADTVVGMESAPDPKQKDKNKNTDNNDDTQASDEVIKEPLTPVPAQDEINPPLEATLGGDDVVTPMEKH